MHAPGRVALITSFALAAFAGAAAAQPPPADTSQAPQSGAQPSTGVQVTPPPGLSTPPAAQPQSPPPAPQPPANDRRASLEVDASALIGSTVRTPDGRDIGRVSRLMVDPRDGRVTTLVIGMGGTLGIGEKHVSVPFNAVRIGQDRQRLVVTLDQRMLDQMPRAESQRQDPAASPPTK